MRYVIGVLGLIIIYEAIARLTEQYERHKDDGHDARLHRVRTLNQRGQPPSEIYY